MASFFYPKWTSVVVKNTNFINNLENIKWCSRGTTISLCNLHGLSFWLIFPRFSFFFNLQNVRDCLNHNFQVSVLSTSFVHLCWALLVQQTFCSFIYFLCFLGGCMCMGVRVGVGMYMNARHVHGDPRTTSSIDPQASSTFCFRQGFSLAWNFGHWDCASQPMSFQRFSWLCPITKHWLTGVCQHTWLFMWILGIPTRAFTLAS